MPDERKEPTRERGDVPRTDLPPTREPYDDDYFGTAEEEVVVREEKIPEDAEEKRTPKGEDL